MRLVITDTGMIWNKDNPFLKRFKDRVLVVCLKGKRVTDEYECFVSPYKSDAVSNADLIGTEGRMYKALTKAAGRLRSKFRHHEDIVFLTDIEPTTLYPFYAVKDLIESNNLHLVAMSSLDFESKDRIIGARNLLFDLSKLESFLYYDISERLEETDKSTELNALLDSIREDMGNMMPCFLNGIHKMFEGPCYFDFASMEYIRLREGYDDIDLNNKNSLAADIDFSSEDARSMKFVTLGYVIPLLYPMEDEDTKECVERPVARTDGKRICNILRDQRLKLAKANGITLESAECPSIGPCAGTCEKCDAEADFLREEMAKIPEDKRIYPRFDPATEVSV